jgi:hypothetical protein
VLAVCRVICVLGFPAPLASSSGGLPKAAKGGEVSVMWELHLAGCLITFWLLFRGNSMDPARACHEMRY